MIAPLFSKICTYSISGRADRVSYSSFHTSTTRDTASRLMLGTERSWRGEKQITLQTPLSDSARNSGSSPRSDSGVSGNNAEKSLTKTKVSA